MGTISETLIIGNNQKINYLIDAEFGSEARKKFNVNTYNFAQGLSHLSQPGAKPNLENSKIIVLLQTEDITATIQFLNAYKSIPISKNNLYIMAVESKPLDAVTKSELENKGVYCFVSLPIPVQALELMTPGNNVKENKEEAPEVQEEEDNSHFFSYGGFMNLVY